MSEDRFKFISPGVFIEEVDKSFIPELPDRMGPVVVGRFKKGPSNRPIKVKSYNELVEVFGTPAPGNASGDIWRSGAMTAPTYAAYAAQAWLRNNTPCTIVRLLGVQHPDAVSYATNTTAPAGWRTDNMHSQASATATGGAYGLFVMPDPDSTTHGATAASVALTIDPLAKELMEIVDRIKDVYESGESGMPPSLEQLEKLVRSSDFAGIKSNITHIWNDLLKWHQKDGSRLQHKVTTSFNTINTIARRQTG